MRRLKKWPLLYRWVYHYPGKTFQSVPKASGVSTHCIWANCAQSESPEHIRDIQRLWPWLTDKEIIQAIRFERSRGKCAGMDRYD